MRTLTSTQFRDALAKGLGRAVEHVRSQPARSVRGDLLYACLHNLRYDYWFEEGRDDWLMELINLTGDAEFYRCRIVRALAKARKRKDVDQLFVLAALFAGRGDAESRQAVYERFDRFEPQLNWMRYKAVVLADGMRGLEHIVERVGEYARLGHEVRDPAAAYEVARIRFGVRRVRAALRKWAARSQNARAYMELVLPKVQSRRWSPLRKVPPTATLVRKIMGEPVDHRYIGVLHAHGTKEQIADFYRQILREKYLDRVWRGLKFFSSWPPLPWLEPALFRWARSRRRRLRSVAINALASVQAPEVREFALGALQDKRLSWRWNALRLLQWNFVRGDGRWLEPLLRSVRDRNTIHEITVALRDIAKGKRYRDLRSCFIWGYEQTPCSFCRRCLVETLIERGCAPRWLLGECLSDFNDDTREFARKALHALGVEPTGHD
ncbi:MAG: hypothetical protein ABSA67_03190 [Candidatus Brocadiia bacterium]